MHAFFYSPWLEPDVRARWQRHAEQVPWTHYLADPDWAEVERSGQGRTARRPFFFWGEQDGEVCLTALGVRRQLPIPGRSFWEFSKGPTFLDGEVFDHWLGWLDGVLAHDAARIRVAPPLPLDGGGDAVESTLERHGYVRHRLFGTWATLCIDLSLSEEALLASFRSSTRQEIRKCLRLGVAVQPEDTAEGQAILCDLQRAMRERAPVETASPDLLARISRYWLRGGSGGTVLIAREGNQPLAAALVIIYRERAHLRMLPSARNPKTSGKASGSHLLLWEAIRWARARGCTLFDLGGYSLMARPEDPLWGVNFFKRGFAPTAEPEKVVAVHEKMSSPTIAASAYAVRRLHTAVLRRRAGGRRR